MFHLPSTHVRVTDWRRPSLPHPFFQKLGRGAIRLALFQALATWMLIWLATRLLQLSGILRRSPPKSLSHLAAQYPPAYLPAYFSSVAGCSTLFFSDCFLWPHCRPFWGQQLFCWPSGASSWVWSLFLLLPPGSLVPISVATSLLLLLLWLLFCFFNSSGFLVKFLLFFLIDRPLTWWPSWALESSHFSLNRKRWAGGSSHPRHWRVHL